MRGWGLFSSLWWVIQVTEKRGGFTILLDSTSPWFCKGDEPHNAGVDVRSYLVPQLFVRLIPSTRTAINFLTATGQKCTDLHQGEVEYCKICHNLLNPYAEFILLSDTLGVSSLVNIINNAKPPGATEATVLGPFFTEDAHDSNTIHIFDNLLIINISD